MRKVETKQYQTFEAYKEFEEVFRAFGQMVLFAMAQFPATTRDTIIRNFIARALVMLRGIFQLWEIEDYQDCWVLHRCMLDRLFHLNELIVGDEFELFENWSFEQQYNTRNKIRSDSQYNSRLFSDFWKDTPEQKARMRQLQKDKPKWKRPFVEDIAKRMKLTPLYDYGYDYGSTLVHPMANDGQRDFVNLTNLGNKDEFPDERTVINNSSLVALLIMREGIKGSGLLWRGFVSDILEEFPKFFEDGSKAYKTTFMRIVANGPDIIPMFCAKAPASDKA
jgi:hypothetical protein